MERHPGADPTVLADDQQCTIDNSVGEIEARPPDSVNRWARERKEPDTFGLDDKAERAAHRYSERGGMPPCVQIVQNRHGIRVGKRPSDDRLFPTTQVKCPNGRRNRRVADLPEPAARTEGSNGYIAAAPPPYFADDRRRNKYGITRDAKQFKQLRLCEDDQRGCVHYGRLRHA